MIFLCNRANTLYLKTDYLQKNQMKSSKNATLPDFGKADWKKEITCLKRQKIGRKKSRWNYQTK